MKILVTDCFNRKAFDIVNILQRSYSKDTIILASSKTVSIREQIIYRKRIIRIYKHNQQSFNAGLLKVSRMYSNEKIIYIPVEEDTTCLFLNFIKDTGSHNFNYCLPDIESFALARDKLLLNKFCIINKIPAPSIFEDIDYTYLNDNFVSLIAKPRIGSGAKGIINVDTIDDIYKLKNIKNIDNYVVQEKLKNGKDVKGAFFLCYRGNIIESYCHERIRTYPISGGVSVYSKITFNNEIIRIGSELLKKMNWSGFAMIEFLWDEKTETYKVIEINPRLWGSILLSEFAGTNFLKNYINLSLSDSIENSLIRKDVKIRWLPFDFVNWFVLHGKIKSFWKLNREFTCFINITYASWWSIFWFHLFFYLNLSNFKTLLEKWKK